MNDNNDMPSKVIDDAPYIGRFAPSPSGKLHFGSLISAVASFCDAKAHKGKWLVRIEDIDPPREEAGASTNIIESLEAHGLLWDGNILYQSSRLEAYQQAFEKLKETIYPCDCIRKRIVALGGRYDGYCRDKETHAEAMVAWRLNTAKYPELHPQCERFSDIFLGRQFHTFLELGDCIIKRKDTLFSYQLAVVVDDLFQGINHIIRGQDLLESTHWQRYLALLLTRNSKPATQKLPIYGHTPLALGKDGHKLSKQAKSPTINNTYAASNLAAALAFLGHPPPIELVTKIEGNKQDQLLCSEILQWACAHWHRHKVPKHSSVAEGLTDA